MRRRRGLAALPLVVGLIGFLLVAAVFRLYGTGTALHQAARDAGGHVAECVATSAIEEALWIFQEKVNDPGDPLFESVRRALLAGDEPELDLSAALAPTRLPGLMAESPHRSFYKRVRIESMVATLRVPLRGAAIDRLGAREADRVAPPGEQILDLACAAALELQGHTIHRQVFVRRRYGITYVSPFKPFDAVTFAIVQSEFLAGYRGVVDGMAQTLAQLEAANAMLDDLASYLRWGQSPPGGVPLEVLIRPVFVTLGRPPPMPPPARDALQAALDRRPARDPLAEEIRTRPWDEIGWQAWGLVVGGPGGLISRVMPSQAPSSPPALAFTSPAPQALARDLPSPDSVIFSNASRVELADFDYERPLEEVVTPLLADLTAAAEAWNRSLAELVAAPGTPITHSEVNALEARVRTLGQAAGAPLVAGIQAMNRVTEHLKRHTRLGFNRDALQGYLATSSKRLRSLAFHAESGAELEALHKGLPAMNGHVAYYGTEPLVLEMRGWKGMTVFSAPWAEVPVPISIPAFTLDDPARDLVAMNFDSVQFGSGAIEASIFVNREARFDGSPAIKGNLVLNRLPSRAERGPRGDLRGSVVRDPRIRSGGYWKRAPDDGPWSGPLPEAVSLGHYTVGLCPRGGEKAIERAPGSAGLVLAPMGDEE